MSIGEEMLAQAIELLAGLTGTTEQVVQEGLEFMAFGALVPDGVWAAEADLSLVH